MIYELKDTSKVEKLFAGMEDSMIRSCLEKVMGEVYVTDLENPKSAMAFLAGDAFLAGEPDAELAAFKPEGEVNLSSPDGKWEALIQELWPGAYQYTRYAIRKDTKFDRKKLNALLAALPAGYEIKKIDAECYDMCLNSGQFEDAVMHFASKADYLARGRGFAVMKNGKLASAASSYTVYNEGIEIEIDTAEEERRKGLASAVAAKLILSCLDDGLYPSWDAANLESVHLAEKLGYGFSHEYNCYYLSEVFDHVIKNPDRSKWDSFCGRYQRLDDVSRIYEIDRNGDDLYYHFVNPEEGMRFDLRLYPIGEDTFGLNEDDFTLVFADGGMTIDGKACKKL
jgi:GNAT superfamily N-acetyltransferase